MGNSKDFEAPTKVGDFGEDMSDLGAITLISRFIKQLWTHRGLYLGILVLLVLPTVVVHEVILHLVGLDAPTRYEIVQKMAARRVSDAEVESSKFARIVALFLASDLLETVFETIQYTSIVYTAASLLANRTVVLADSVCAIGRLWKPVILTSLSLFAAHYGVLAIAVAIMYAFYLQPSIDLMVQASLLDVALLSFMCFAFQLGPVVPVLEEVYGWKALGRSWKLLQGKKWVALRTIILLVVLLLIISVSFAVFLQVVFMLIGISNVSTAASVANHVFVIVIISVGILLIIGTDTFLYSSCRDLHQESITDSPLFQAQVMKGGYEKVTQHPEMYDVESLKRPGS